MTYRFLTGTFGYSMNPRAHALYCGTIGAFLQSEAASGWQAHIFDESLLPAATWLKRNHPFFAKYSESMIANISQTSLPVAIELQAQDDSFSNAMSRNHQNNNPDIVIPAYDFLAETHDEDFH